MKNLILSIATIAVVFGASALPANAAVLTPNTSPSPTVSPTFSPTPEAIATARPDFTQTKEENLGPLEKVLQERPIQNESVFNLLGRLIRNAISSGMPANTMVLLILMPLVTLAIAAARHIVGIRGFGILLPALLAVAFLAIGPLVGIIFFLVIVGLTIVIRYILRRSRLHLAYLARMSLIIWFVVVGILIALVMAPRLNIYNLVNVSIFPVLVLILLADDFTRVQIGKSFRIAIRLSIETIGLAFACYFLLTWQSLQELALLYPEALLLIVAICDILLGKYTGLRIREYYRFRKLLKIK